MLIILVIAFFIMIPSGLYQLIELMTYEDKIYNYLDKMKPGTRVEIDKICGNNRDRFLITVIEYIQVHEYGNGIELSNDQNYVKKLLWNGSKS
jgi:hypothetical protein